MFSASIFFFVFQIIFQQGTVWIEIIKGSLLMRFELSLYFCHRETWLNILDALLIKQERAISLKKPKSLLDLSLILS